MEARPGRRAGDKGVTGGAHSPGELVVVATPIGNFRRPLAASCRHARAGGCRLLRGHAPYRSAARPPGTARLPSALGARAQRDRTRGGGARDPRARCQGCARERRRHAGGVRPRRAPDLGGHRCRAQGHDRAGTVGGRERPGGGRARDDPLEIRRLPAPAWARARQTPRRDRAGRAPERDLRVAPAGRRDPA